MADAPDWLVRVGIVTAILSLFSALTWIVAKASRSAAPGEITGAPSVIGCGLLAVVMALGAAVLGLMDEA